MDSIVDLVVLSRREGPLHPQVRRGIQFQTAVHLRIHRVIGRVRQCDSGRWSVIARARNHGKDRGNQAWLMFLDDDVVLAPGCVCALLQELRRNHHLAAVAADYLKESWRTNRRGHVAMGATLFRREDLQQITFRWQPGRCECQCCCDDLRRRQRQIAYSSNALAEHLRVTPASRMS